MEMVFFMFKCIENWYTRGIIFYFSLHEQADLNLKILSLFIFFWCRFIQFIGITIYTMFIVTSVILYLLNTILTIKTNYPKLYLLVLIINMYNRTDKKKYLNLLSIISYYYMRTHVPPISIHPMEILPMYVLS